MKFRTIILTLFTTLLVSGVVLYSCTRKKVDYLGPEYLSAPDGFSATLGTITNPLNFAAPPGSTCTLTAMFSTRVTYTVTYKGEVSGAVKSYTGVSDHINAATPGGSWNGCNDGLYMFKSGEWVDVTISFLRSTFVLKTKTHLLVGRNPAATNNMILLLGPNNSYEGGASLTNGFPLEFSFTNAVTLPPTNPAGWADNKPASSEGIKAIEGDNVLRISGVSNQPDGFFVGGIQHRKGNLHFNNSFMLPSTWTDPTKIYFNVYIYGSGHSNATVNLEFDESDASNPNNSGTKTECSPGNPSPNAENSYDHDPCTDDGWVYGVPIDFTGWKLVSIKYSDCARSASLNNGGSGDGVKEPTRVARIQMGVVSTPAFKDAYVLFDYAVITYGAPFDPSK